MKKLAVVGALGIFVSGLFAQGLTPPSSQAKDDWEEINFEFNSSILSDGYPSLLRLAEILGQHKDYKVKVTGNTDYVGSARYNEGLAMRRAETVKSFLVKYGASADQVTTAGNGKRDPEVNNRTKEGRFMNRRVVLTVTDGQGRVVKEGSIKEVMPYMDQLADLAKKQQECCDQILKRLDKLDDILAALKALQGENDQLKGELADQRNQLNALRDQVNGMPKPLTAQETQNIAHTEAQGALDEAQRRNKKFSLLGLNVGPTFGGGKQRNSDFTVSGSGQFFSPFGGSGAHAVQAQGEYMYYPGRQEGQFDIGLVNRWGAFQMGTFASFKYLNFRDYQHGGGLGQADVLFDYIFKGGRVGLFATQGFKNYAVLISVTIAPGAFLQTYARIDNQYGADALFGVWGDAYIQGNLGAVNSHQPVGGGTRPGADLKLVQPFSEHFAFTVEGSYNTTYVAPRGSGQLVFGVQYGSYIHPKDYGTVKSPVPMDVPRIRYSIATRRVGSSPPVADAGPNQLGVAAGTITLNGTGSYDPLGEALTYQWTQTSGPTVSLNGANTATATFTAAAGATYAFRLTVRNTDGLQSSATTTVSTATPSQTQILQFTANPANIQAGQSSTLTWVVQNATSVTIQPGIGGVNANSGSTSVTPTQTTTYTLTATGPSGTVNQTVTVTVGALGPPQIVRFEAVPLSIAPGQSSTLSWATNGATSVSIDNGVGTVPANGSTTVTPAKTTTYTLTATNGSQSVTTPVTVTVTTGQVPQIVVFSANPQNISPGQTTQLCWQVVSNIQPVSISIQPGVGSNLNANDCATVKPSTTTTYVLTASNSAGQFQASTTVNVGLVQILSFTANPPFSPASGAPVVLSWQTANATSVVLIGGDVPPTTLQANGSFTINPTSNETYTLTAYGPGGQTVSVTISVFVR